MALPARAGEARCWFEHGAIVVPAALGDIAGDFLLDPASPRTLVHAGAAEGFGLTGPEVRADLRFAGLRRAITAKSVDLGPRARPFVAGLAGVIGADALAGYAIEIRTLPCRLKVGRRITVPRGALPLRRIAGVWAVPAAISDGMTSRAGWFAVATAQPGVTVRSARLSRAPPPDADPDWPPARLRALSLGGRLFENVPAGVDPSLPPALAGAIGEAVWWRHGLGLDTRRGELWIMPGQPAPGAPRAPNGAPRALVLKPALP